MVGRNLLGLGLLFLCSCTRLPATFDSKDEAFKFIESRHLTQEVADTSMSSWLRSATYYHDKSGLGYGVFQIRDRRYIHARLPRNIWEEFKSAPSQGRYYNRHIKGRYEVEFEAMPSN
ncbi:MAG: KTSC domain-containing protein [Planctomycetota bacterium]|nr:KTSC domain-containing protein [Planctomycetota bacterium]MDA1139663.1 KTSC domain-containing protein [Planctomycetota bacterium]